MLKVLAALREAHTGPPYPCGTKSPLHEALQTLSIHARHLDEPPDEGADL